MKILDSMFKKKQPLNFESLLIITYGRSGSTLLMGVLNSIEGVVVRGENYDFCFYLYRAYKSLLNSKNQSGTKSQHPFFGSSAMDEQQLLIDYSQLVKNLLLSEHLKNPKKIFQYLKTLIFDHQKIIKDIRCYGFKEVRYERHLGEFNDYLSFLEKIFPNPCFIINTRNHEDVLKSMKAVDFYTEKPFDQDYLRTIEATFFDYIKTHPDNTFHISYEDVIAKTEKLTELFSFLGASFSEQQIDEVLSLQHSYAPAQEHVNKLPYNFPK